VVGKSEGDIYLLETDSQGSEIWSKTVGGQEIDEGHSVHISHDNGYIVCGTKYSDQEESDLYLLETDLQGNERWSRIFDHGDFDVGYSIQTGHDSYVVTGSTFLDKYGFSDVILVKADRKGELQWSLSLGGDNNDEGLFTLVTSDQHYLVCGYTSSFGYGKEDLFLVKS